MKWMKRVGDLPNDLSLGVGVSGYSDHNSRLIPCEAQGYFTV
jgi:hypothetical protein